eukprot:GHVT01000507.1.p1 GENE.GHVT01000507.1~~GHVT01000507.1.p1  ORF type:complete len:232 (+),score=32.82 GHVT01000507.1:555-1250(+)
MREVDERLPSRVASAPHKQLVALNGRSPHSPRRSGSHLLMSFNRGGYYPNNSPYTTRNNAGYSSMIKSMGRNGDASGTKAHMTRSVAGSVVLTLAASVVLCAAVGLVFVEKIQDIKVISPEFANQTETPSSYLGSPVVQELSSHDGNSSPAAPEGTGATNPQTIQNPDGPVDGAAVETPPTTGKPAKLKKRPSRPWSTEKTMGVAIGYTVAVIVLGIVTGFATHACLSAGK